jgi:hypothetical protein
MVDGGVGEGGDRRLGRSVVAVGRGGLGGWVGWGGCKLFWLGAGEDSRALWVEWYVVHVKCVCMWLSCTAACLSVYLSISMCMYVCERTIYIATQTQRHDCQLNSLRCFLRSNRYTRKGIVPVDSGSS